MPLTSANLEFIPLTVNKNTREISTVDPIKSQPYIRPKTKDQNKFEGERKSCKKNHCKFLQEGRGRKTYRKISASFFRKNATKFWGAENDIRNFL